MLIKSSTGFDQITIAEFLQRYKNHEHVAHFSDEAVAVIFEHIEELQEFCGGPSDPNRFHNYDDWTVYFQDAKQLTSHELVISLEQYWLANAAGLIDIAIGIEDIPQKLLNRSKKIPATIHFKQIKDLLMSNDEYIKRAAELLSFSSGMAFREIESGWVLLHLE